MIKNQTAFKYFKKHVFKCHKTRSILTIVRRQSWPAALLQLKSFHSLLKQVSAGGYIDR